MKKMYKKPITESLSVQAMTNICDPSGVGSYVQQDPTPGLVPRGGAPGNIDDPHPSLM